MRSGSSGGQSRSSWKSGPRSFSSKENVYVLVSILLLSLGYILWSIASRKLQGKKTAERKRRLLGIPDIAVSGSKDKDSNSRTSLLASVMLSLAGTRARSGSTVAIKSDVADHQKQTMSSIGSASTSATSNGHVNGKKGASQAGGSGSTLSLATPLRQARGRATSTATTADRQLSPLSPLSTSEMPSASTSRKSSRSMSNSTNSPSNSRQRDKAASVGLAKPKRSIGIQVPSESDDERIRSEVEQGASQRISRRPSPALANTAASALQAISGGTESSLNTEERSHEHKQTHNSESMQPNAKLTIATMDQARPSLPPLSPPHQEDVSHGGPGRKARASLAKQNSKASIPGLSHSPSRREQQSDTLLADLTESPKAYHSDLHASRTLYAPPSIGHTAVSQASSRDQSISGRSASWSVSTDDTTSTNLTSISSKNSEVTGVHGGAKEKGQIQPYCFHSSFQTYEAEDDKAMPAPRETQAASGDSSREDLTLRYLPTPPDSQRKPRANENDTRYGMPHSPLGPVHIQYTQAGIAGDASYMQQAQYQQYLQHYQQMLQMGQYPQMPLAVYPSSPQAGPSSAQAGHSNPNSRPVSPLPGQPIYVPYSPMHSQVSPGVVYSQASSQAQQQQQQQIDAHQAQQLEVLRNMQTLQAQAAYAQTGLHPSVGTSGTASAPLLPGMQYQLPSPGLMPQASPNAAQQHFYACLSPTSPASLGTAQPYSPNSLYSVPPTSRHHLGRQQVPQPSGSSTSYADGTVVYRSGPAHRRQTSYSEQAISTPPSSQTYKGRQGSRKFGKDSQRRMSVYESVTPDMPGSPTPSGRDSVGDESLTYSIPRKANYRRRGSLAPPSPSLGATRQSSPELDNKVQEADLDFIRKLDQEEDLDAEEMRIKMKNMAAILERKGKEVEISNWKLKCVEVDRLNTENEHQKALNHFYERAERAEARLKLLESKPANGTPSTASTASPLMSRHDVSHASDHSEASTDGRDDISSIDQNEPVLTFTASSSAATPTFDSPVEYQSPISAYSPNTFSPNIGKPLRYPPHPFITRKGSKKGKKGRRSEPLSLPSYARRGSSSKLSDASFDAFGDGEEEHDGSESEDLEIVMDSYTRSPNLVATNPNGGLSSLEPLGAPLSGKTIGLGVSVAQAGEEARTEILPANCVGSLPSFTFSKPPASPTKRSAEPS